MCGITGFYSTKNKVDSNFFYNLHLKIAHRGPDDEGFIFKDDDENIKFLFGKDTMESLKDSDFILDKKDFSFILGHRRLSIIDLSELGHQPFMYNGLYLVYNGEIFNYIELKKELENNGYIFLTQSDTEVFLKAYHFWGADAFNKFNGMWAAAIYNSKDETLTLTRDRFGVKPLYYSIENDNLIFASEIKFIAPFFKKLQAEPTSVMDFLNHAYIDHNDKTFYKGISQVCPGSYIVFDKFIKIKKNKYWNLQPEEQACSLGDILIDAVRLRMRSDVPVGTLLSGGIDSSLITSIIKKELGVNDISTFSAIFEGYPQFSEDELIRENVTFLKTKHHYITPTIDDLKIDFHDLLYCQEIPIRSFSIYAQYSIYKHIRNYSDIKVLLNGQGADEIFSGYSDHGYYYLASLLQGLNIKNFAHEIKLLSKIRNEKLLSILFKILKIVVKHYLRYTSNNFKDIFQNKLYKDLSFSALKEYLHYDDRNSMRFSLESRTPFLDFRVVKYAFFLDNDAKYSNSTTKKILRDIGKKYISESVLKNNKKMGFISPQEIWQKKELKDMFNCAFEDISKNILFDFIDNKKLVKIYKRYCDNKFKDWHYIWRIFILYHWKKVWGIK
ncbi:asparagine synthase (glutamine-hydrolyzing) [Campylobacter sp. MOP51]|uniref:asparagine synthase (glutamine-hydrolyzing) n=1 Tax=Campylobacter canis TaxID=3378588 RepID=UPI003C5C8127